MLIRDTLVNKFNVLNGLVVAQPSGMQVEDRNDLERVKIFGGARVNGGYRNGKSGRHTGRLELVLAVSLSWWWKVLMKRE